MADAITVTEETPPRKGGKLKSLLLGLGLLLAGAGLGTVGTLFAPKLLPGLFPPEQAPKPPKPQVAPLTYVELPGSLTANLRDSDRYIQVRIALSTHGGTTVAEAVDRHKLAITAAALGVLTDTTEADLSAPGGRDRLATRMRIAINDVLQRKSGVTGIDDVLFTSFVVQ
ncbi:MAG: flagellar basal body-associated FliL family protein [Sphingomonadaceae bacterium]|uniref:flagellar basal body-associated FliL family protein n=1 Tax=Thermaurantiacus sp. TaxID=2820283 RepID=UPI00298EF7BB|nr:flagellar basal body-associated FliL family protein [Thermaurantiacus sp.]MCS6987007.1 flagellar basal body-associated FliL family protein [Sphingomonadaceae bacterium]MDW8415655.1 flagellar basal body-associated FliL family protein [Thermaurantiacus sp.]